MSENKREVLSALVDGELADEAGSRVVDEMLSDRMLRRRWAAYHLIGDVMRKHLLDERAFGPTRPAGANAVRAARGGWLRPASPLAGLALAGSVALVAVLGIYAVSDQTSEPVAVAESTLSSDDSAVATPASAAVAVKDAERSRSAARLSRDVVAGGAAGIDAARMSWNDSAPALARRLNGYLVTHNESLANSMHGMLPYARLVAYDDRN